MKVRESQPDFEERATIIAVQQGDRDAFKALYERYRDRVYNIIFYSIGDELRAEDVLQIVFLKIFRGLADFRFEASLATWIYRVTLNECFNQQRGRGAQHIPFEALLGSDEELDTSAAADLQHAEGERYRTAVVLRDIEDLSYEEIASVLECSPGTVASRLNRALSELEARLRPLRRLL